MSKMNEFIAALREGKGYGWIANHGYSLSKEELCNIIKEYDYAFSCETMKMEMYCAVANELEEMYEEE